MQVKGIKRGKTIELLQDIDLPDGVEITVEVKTVPILSLSETPEPFKSYFWSLAKSTRTR
ncbi:MAG: hypothetical protein RSE13_02970 [Planktothrix sp. GU0601_MAG3]|nr:MAG: hypothetical protein RSE13_02970 [Planktothrix sp. GU0601_MAG3]